MKIIIEINTDGAAFEDNPFEKDDVLDQAMHKLDVLQPGYSATLYDTNGNRCGQVTKHL